MTTTGGIQRNKDDLASGVQIGRYRIQHPVGRGGMGTVYSAFDKTTNRVVALKLLAADILPSLRDRFLAECEAEANIRHEHVMPVYDRGWWTDEQPYFVMELLYQPVTLTDIMDEIDQGHLGQVYPRIRHWADLRRLIADVLVPICDGVHVANVEYGIQHRDLKPDNILIDIRTKRPYLIDFGICRAMDDDSDAGKIVGTPRFLSPEQAGGRPSEQTDVWGLGALLRYAVTGAPPLAGTSPFTRKAVAERIAALKKAEHEALEAGKDAKARGYAGRRAQLEDPTLRTQEDLMEDALDGVYLPLPEGTSAGLSAIIKKAMAKRPEDRYENAGALVGDLRRWLGGGSVQALAEEGARGAAADYVRRLFNRNTVRGGGALVTLVIGFLIGSGLFSTTPAPVDHRLEDWQTDTERLGVEANALMVEGSLSPLLRTTLLHGIRAEADSAYASATASLEEARSEDAEIAPGPLTPDRAAWLEAHAFLHEVRVAGWHSRGWDVYDFLGRGGPHNAGALHLPPGLYLIQSRPHGLRARLAIPSSAGEQVLEVGSLEGRVPAEALWVPAGPAPGGAGGGAAGAHAAERVAPFLATRDFITNERYSEWLDDLPSAGRRARVPPTGFRRDEGDTSRWLVAQGAANKPVVGIKPDDAQAYADWRSEIDGVTYALPTPQQWERMAGIEYLREPGNERLFPWRLATTWLARHRRGDRKSHPPSRWYGDGESPYGIARLFVGPGEIVRTNDGAAYAVKGAGGIVPIPSAVERVEPISADAAGHGYGFRLVYLP